VGPECWCRPGRAAAIAQFEEENFKLKLIVADMRLDKPMLQTAVEKELLALSQRRALGAGSDPALAYTFT
jgi:hypothetical protein